MRVGSLPEMVCLMVLSPQSPRTRSTSNRTAAGTRRRGLLQGSSANHPGSSAAAPRMRRRTGRAAVTAARTHEKLSPLVDYCNPQLSTRHHHAHAAKTRRRYGARGASTSSLPVRAAAEPRCAAFSKRPACLSGACAVAAQGAAKISNIGQTAAYREGEHRWQHWPTDYRAIGRNAMGRQSCCKAPPQGIKPARNAAAEVWRRARRGQCSRLPLLGNRTFPRK